MTEDDHRTVDEALARTALSDLRERPITTLSGGERQRALIARALAQQPRVLLLDEPTAHLDLRYQATVLEMVRGLVESDGGLAVAMSLHDLNLASLFADRLALLAEGKTDREIAHGLGIAESTAKNHVSNILGKLNVPNRAGAVAAG